MSRLFLRQVGTVVMFNDTIWEPHKGTVEGVDGWRERVRSVTEREGERESGRGREREGGKERERGGGGENEVSGK